jgi:hypothetical protein
MRDDGQLVIALSGRTKAGKSRIANELAERLDWHTVSFGNYVRAEACRLDCSNNREDLQELGADMIKRLGWREFCQRTLAHGGIEESSVPCIIEGVRHLDALETLSDIFAPSPVYLIHLDVADQERERRLRAEGVALERGATWEQHSTERDVIDALPAQAVLRVETEDSVQPPVDAIMHWLQATRA